MMIDQHGDVIPKEELDRGLTSAGLSALAREVERTWRAEDYPPNMRGPQAQFRHALIHATKALGKIAALADYSDHDRLDEEEARALRTELPKLLADLIRCAAKMAEKAPYGAIPLASAYIDRADGLAKRWGYK